MLFRFAGFGVLAMVLMFVALGCGGSESVSEDVTPELVVPAAEQGGSKQLSETPSPTATPTPQPTATATIEPTSTVAPVPTETPEPPRVKVPNRGYNSMGSDDAPIVMFDFSDFL